MFIKACSWQSNVEFGEGVGFQSIVAVGDNGDRVGVGVSRYGGDVKYRPCPPPGRFPQIALIFQTNCVLEGIH
jgi:hypothetical protein